MIPENAVPALFAIAAPINDDAAAARMSELIIGNGPEALVGTKWLNLAQIKAALICCEFFLKHDQYSSHTNSVENAEVSVTHVGELNYKENRRWTFIVNTLGGDFRVLNVIQTNGEPYEPPKKGKK